MNIRAFCFALMLAYTSVAADSFAGQTAEESSKNGRALDASLYSIRQINLRYFYTNKFDLTNIVSIDNSPYVNSPFEYTPRGFGYTRWISLSNGSFHDDFNWDTGITPGQDTRIMFDRTDPSSIYLEEPTTIKSLYAFDGYTSLDLNEHALTLNQDGFDDASLVVSRDVSLYNGPAELTISNGTLNTLGESYIGRYGVHYGVMRLENNAVWNSDSNLYVGSGGVGELEIVENSTLNAMWMLVGDNSSLEGHVTLSNSTMDVENVLSLGLDYGYGSLNADDGAILNTNYFLIGNSGDGYASLQGASQVTVDLEFVVGRRYGSHGSLIVSEGSTVTSVDAWIGSEEGSTGQVEINNGTWNTSTLSIGYEGSGNLNIEAGGTVNATNSWIGHETGGSGHVSVDNATWITNGELQVTRYGDASLTASNGAYIYANDMWIGNFAGSTGTVEVSGGSEIQVGHDSNDGFLRIGREGDGELTINGGSVRARIIGTGVEQGGSGRITLESGLISTDGSGNTFTIGEAGTGYLDMSGGHLVSSNLVFGFLPGSTSNANITGGRMAGYDLELGGIDNAIGGNATISLSGGEIDTVRGYFWSTGTLNATGGTIDIDQSYLRGGHLSFANGTYNLGDLLENNGSIELHSGSLSFNGAAPNSLAWYGGNLTALSSDLNLSTTEGFTSESRIGDGTHGTLRIGGHLSAPSGGVTIVDGGYLEAGSFGGTVSIRNGGNAIFNNVLYGNSNSLDLQDGSVTLRSAEPTNRIRINTSFGSTLRDLAVIEPGEHVTLLGYASPYGATNNLGPPMRLDGGYLRTRGFESFYDGFSGAGFVFDSGTLRIDGTTYVGDGPGMWTPNDLELTSDRKLGTDYLVVENGTLTVTDPDALSYNNGSIYFYGGEITIPEFLASWGNNWTRGTLHETRTDGFLNRTYEMTGLDQGKTWITDARVYFGADKSSPIDKIVVPGGHAVFNDGFIAQQWIPSPIGGMTLGDNFTAEVYGDSVIDGYTILNSARFIDFYGNLSILSSINDTGELIFNGNPSGGSAIFHNGSTVNIGKQGLMEIKFGTVALESTMNIVGGTLAFHQTEGEAAIFGGGPAIVNISDSGTLSISGVPFSYTEYNVNKTTVSGHGSVIDLGYINGYFLSRTLEISDGGLFTTQYDSTSFLNTIIVSDGNLYKPNITLTESSIVSGDSTLSGDVVNSGIIGDQLRIDSIAIDGSFTQSMSGILDINFNSFLNHDTIDISGVATLGGTLRIHFGSDIPLFENGYTFLTANEILGEFDSVEFVGTPNIYELVIGTSGITLCTIPGPGTFAHMIPMLGLFGTRRRRLAS